MQYMEVDTGCKVGDSANQQVGLQYSPPRECWLCWHSKPWTFALQVSVRAQARDIGMRAIRAASSERTLEESLARERKVLLAALTSNRSVQDIAAGRDGAKGTPRWFEQSVTFNAGLLCRSGANLGALSPSLQDLCLYLGACYQDLPLDAS